MDHSVPLITTIAAAFGLALLLGYFAARVKLSPLIGYLLAGIMIGPGTPGFVADVKIAAELAEIGVMLLMFGVGLHFSIKELLSVRKIALPGAIVQMAVATAMGAGAALAWGWSMAGALVLGLSLSVASTVVLLKALEARGVLQTMNGRIASSVRAVAAREDLRVMVVDDRGATARDARRSAHRGDPLFARHGSAQNPYMNEATRNEIQSAVARVQSGEPELVLGIAEGEINELEVAEFEARYPKLAFKLTTGQGFPPFMRLQIRSVR